MDNGSPEGGRNVTSQTSQTDLKAREEETEEKEVEDLTDPNNWTPIKPGEQRVCINNARCNSPKKPVEKKRLPFDEIIVLLEEKVKVN